MLHLALVQKYLSKLAGWLANSECKILKNYLISYFLKRYPVDLSLALETDPYAYKSFNAFFTRALKTQARIWQFNPNLFLSPVEGKVAHIGRFNEAISVKNETYSLAKLLGPLYEAKFEHAAYASLYLAPRDYHRVHMPISGQLLEMVYIPGSLFSVNTELLQEIPDLFARNERLICSFMTARGKVFIILVAAMLVGNIHTTWAGLINAQHKNKLEYYDYSLQNIHLEQGVELGHFSMGSTVILLTEAELNWQKTLDSSLVLGEILASYGA